MGLVLGGGGGTELNSPGANDSLPLPGRAETRLVVLTPKHAPATHTNGRTGCGSCVPKNICYFPKEREIRISVDSLHAALAVTELSHL